MKITIETTVQTTLAEIWISALSIAEISLPSNSK